MANVIEKCEDARGCGYRKGGGFYLVSDFAGKPCGRLPLVLRPCPCCGSGLKYSRGVTWVDPNPLLKDVQCFMASGASNFTGIPDCDCPMASPEKMGRWECRIESSMKAAGKTKRLLESRLMPGIRNLEIVEGTKVDGRSDKEVPTYTVRGFYPHVMLLWVGHKFYKTTESYLSEARRMGISRRVKSIPHNFVLGKTWVWLAHIEAVATEDGTYEPAVFHAFQPQRMEYVVAEGDDEEKLDRLEKQGFTLVKVTRLGEQTEFSDDDDEE